MRPQRSHSNRRAQQSEPLSNLVGSFLSLPAVSSVGLFLSICGVPNATLAQVEDCFSEPKRFEPQQVIPAVGARAVTLDAVVRVEFSEDYFFVTEISPEDSLELFRNLDGVLERVSGTFDLAGGRTLFFVPDQLLFPNSDYEGTAFGSEGALNFAFRTGDQLDRSPPQVFGIDSTRSSRIGPTCEAPAGGYRIDVSFPPAVDDGPLGSIGYFIYQTRGPLLEAPVLRATLANFATPGLLSVGFVIDRLEATEPICVAIQAVDGVGNVVETESACFDPIEGNYFESLCAASGSTETFWAAHRTIWIPIALVLCVLGIGRRTVWIRPVQR
ncbi:MAG: hypothetical protein AAF550_04710 [Myxococcota bacterium]